MVEPTLTRGVSPQLARIGAGAGISLASFRRFWAVAARWNPSRAPFGPRNRSRFRFRMRFNWVNTILTFFALAARDLAGLDFGDVAGEIARAFGYKNHLGIVRRHADAERSPMRPATTGRCCPSLSIRTTQRATFGPTPPIAPRPMRNSSPAVSCARRSSARSARAS